jgi:hypothetical protein
MPENIELKGGESRKEKKRKIRELGFSKEEAVEYLTKHLTIVKLQEKIQSLRSVGFTNPVTLIEKHPPIASYNINHVIQTLQSVGFTNPISLIEKFPQIADLDINRVKKKLQLIQMLNKKFKLEFNPIKIIEKTPVYLGYDLKRIFFYLRIASFYNVDEKFYHQRFIRNNPFIVFNILHNLYLQQQISDKDEFKRLINKIRIFSKETKQTIQNETQNNLPQIIENLKQKQDDPDARFLLKLAGYLEALLKKEEEGKRKKRKLDL